MTMLLVRSARNSIVAALTSAALVASAAALVACAGGDASSDPFSSASASTAAPPASSSIRDAGSDASTNDAAPPPPPSPPPGFDSGLVCYDAAPPMPPIPAVLPPPDPNGGVACEQVQGGCQCGIGGAAGALEFMVCNDVACECGAGSTVQTTIDYVGACDDPQNWQEAFAECVAGRGDNGGLPQK